MVACIALGAVVVAFRIYKTNYNNYRFIANVLITAIILIIIIAYSMNTEIDQNKKVINFYLPLIVCFFLVLCVVYNFGFILYALIKMYQNYKTKQAEYEDMIEFNKTIKEDYIDKMENRARKPSR